MPTIDWSYHRPGCSSCARAQEFLGRSQIRSNTTVDAKKTKLSGEDALRLISMSEHVYIAKGKKIVHFELAEGLRPDDQTILSHMLGPTGNLRAPTIKLGNAVLVGFDENMYSDVLGQMLTLR